MTTPPLPTAAEMRAVYVEDIRFGLKAGIADFRFMEFAHKHWPAIIAMREEVDRRDAEQLVCAAAINHERANRELLLASLTEALYEIGHECRERDTKSAIGKARGIARAALKRSDTLPITTRDRKIAALEKQIAPSPCGHPAICTDGPDNYDGDGVSRCQWCLEIERLNRQLAESREECERLRGIAGLRANPAMNAAVQQHIADTYKNIKPDSCGSAVHKLYETGDCMNGPSVVVEWSDRQVWFSMDGNSVEVDTYLKDASK